MIYVKIPLVITLDFNQGRTQQKRWVYTCTKLVGVINSYTCSLVMRSDTDTDNQIAQTRLDLNTNSQIARARVRVLKFAHQEGKRRGGYLPWWVPVAGKGPDEDMGSRGVVLRSP
jgi:hypothetical protein